MKRITANSPEIIPRQLDILPRQRIIDGRFG